MWVIYIWVSLLKIFQSPNSLLWISSWSNKTWSCKWKIQALENQFKCLNKSITYFQKMTSSGKAQPPLKTPPLNGGRAPLIHSSWKSWTMSQENLEKAEDVEDDIPYYILGTRPAPSHTNINETFSVVRNLFQWLQSKFISTEWWI